MNRAEGGEGDLSTKRRHAEQQAVGAWQEHRELFGSLEKAREEICRHPEMRNAERDGTD